MSFEIVVARYNEDIQWLNPYLDHGSVIIYNKGEVLIDIDPRFKVVELPNIGREAHTFLYYIYNNYDSLKDITIFIQGNISDHISIDVYEYINNILYESCVEHGCSQNYMLYKNIDSNNQYNFRIHEYKDKNLGAFECNFGDFFTTHIQNKFPSNFVFL